MKFFIYCLALFSTTFCFAQKNTNKPVRLLKSETAVAAIDSFENTIKKDIANNLIAGGSYLLYQNGKILATNTIGASDASSNTPLKRNAIFRMASMTKPLASLALLLLQEDGLLNLNDRLDQYIPAFSQPEVLDRMDTIHGVIVLRTHLAKNPITLRNLLTHTTGFAGSFYPKQRDLYFAATKNASNHDLAHYANQLARLPLDFEPGENWQYGPSINIAARVIEVVSGMSFNDFLTKRILAPMQMNDTKFYLDSVDAPRLTSLYTLDKNGKMIMTDPGSVASKLISGPKVYYSASGGINSTLDDYLKFCVMILKNGMHENKMIAKPETIALMKLDQLPSNINAAFDMPSGRPDAGFTFGYQYIRREGAGSPLTEKTISWAGAYGTRFFIDPKRDAVGIYLTQNEEYGQVPSWIQFYDWMMKALL
jgi:CubicO group peptidase (beta-lactamase class C family)